MRLLSIQIIIWSHSGLGWKLHCQIMKHYINCASLGEGKGTSRHRTPLIPPNRSHHKGDLCYKWLIWSTEIILSLKFYLHRHFHTKKISTTSDIPDFLMCIFKMSWIFWRLHIWRSARDCACTALFNMHISHWWLGRLLSVQHQQFAEATTPFLPAIKHTWNRAFL